MIVHVCGPSGSGKTTLLKLILEETDAKVIDVVVSRSNMRKCDEPGKREVTLSEFNSIKSNFQFLYRYNDTVYGYSLDMADIVSKNYVFVDYPGEYPACNELSFKWNGILVLPPDRNILVKRLKQQGKDHRIQSALQEYDEILVELSNGEYTKPIWRVFKSCKTETLRDLVQDVKYRSLFSGS